MKHNLVIKPRPTDYIFGSTSPIKFQAVSNGDWTSHLWFNEDQRNPAFETDGCACYGAARSLDMQMDLLLETAPISIVNQLSTMGFMDVGTDGKKHFHSSPRFIEIQTGNGVNGNSIPECFDVIRNFGILPYQDLPFTPTMTQAEYFIPLTEVQLLKATQFLAVMGGKNFLQYHWLTNGGEKNTALMQSAILQAPLSLGIAINENGWNQTIPLDPPDSQDPQHVVTNYKMVSPAADVVDNYVPYDKVLDGNYPIHYILQAVVTILTPVTPPVVIPPIPTTVQPTQNNVNILTQIVAIYTTILNLLKGRTLSGTNNMINFSFAKSGAFWSSVVLVLSAVFTSLASQYPTVFWFGSTVSVLSFISVNYFHKQAVLGAARSSATLGKPVSGQ